MSVAVMSFPKAHSLSTGGAHSRVEASITSPTSPPYVAEQFTALFHTQPLLDVLYCTVKASLRLEAAKRPRWPRVYSSGRPRSCNCMPSLVGDHGPVLGVLGWALTRMCIIPLLQASITVHSFWYSQSLFQE